MLNRPNADVLSKPISLLARVGRQARNYTSAVVFLVYEAFHGHFRQLAAALALNLLYIAGQMGAIGVIYGYARLMQRHEPLKVPWFDITIDPSQPGIVWAMVGISGLVFLASGAFQYWARRITYKIAEENLTDSCKSLIVISSRLPDPRAPLASRMIAQQGFQKILGGSRRGALMAVIFFTALSGAVGAVLALVFLLAMDPVLTLLILAGVALGAFSLYPVALRGVRLSKQRERTQIALNKEVQELSLSGRSAELVSGMQTPAAFAAAFMGQRRILAEFTLVLSIVVTIIIAVVVYYMANQALSGRGSWAIFIAYIGALRLVLMGSTQLIRAFAGVSRFYPQLVPYYTVMRDSPRMDKAPLATVSRDEAIFLGSQANGERIIVHGGDRIAVATTDSIRHVQCAMMEAKAPGSGMPIGTTILRSGVLRNAQAGIATLELDQLGSANEHLASLDGLLRDKVVLMIHPSPKTVGTFGEKTLLTVDEFAIERFVPLGTSESDLILEEFAKKAAAHAGRAPLQDEEEEEI